MANLHFGKSKFSRFIKGRGFYIALALCIVGAGAASWVAIDKTMNNLQGNGVVDKAKLSSIGTGEGDEWNFPGTEDVGKNQSGVPVESGSSTSSSNQGQSSGSQSQDSKNSGTSSNSSTSAQGQQTSLYVLPVEGDVLSAFSNGELVKSKTLGDWRTHNGVDLVSKQGTAVKSASAGKVSKIYEDAMWGQVVEITHDDGIVAIYKGLNKNLNVEQDQTVKAGQVIGSIGETASAEASEESHLHFEMMKDGKYLDPLKTMNKIG